MKKICIKICSAVVCAAIIVTSLALFASCRKSEDANNENNKILVANGESEYVIIRPDKVSKELLDIIVYLHQSVKDKIGYDFNIGTDWVKSRDEIDPNAKEILIGNTNRPETQEVIDSLEPNSWAVVDKGNKIVICANNDSLLSGAVDWFLQNCVNAQDKTVKIEKELFKSEGFGNALPLSVSGISNYQIVYPKGNKSLEYYASLIQRKSKITSVVSDDKAQSDYEIVIGDASRDGVESVSGKNKYLINTNGAKVFINASDEDALYYAVNYYIEYALTRDETIVSAPADYSAGGELKDYYKENWSLGLPYFEGAKVSPIYNAGPGLLDDSTADTVSDSYMHVVDQADEAMLEKYANKLESFGFKKIDVSTTEKNELWSYRLGMAYAYIHYAPTIKQIRVIWDRSSNCDISDFEYTEAATGTTTFYQYSIDYEFSKLNYSGVVAWGMSYIIKLQDNSLILVDGGNRNQANEKSAEGYRRFLYDITGTDKDEPLKIRLWYFTHSDSDHTGFAHTFLGYLSKKGYKAPIVDTFAFNFPSSRANTTLGKDADSFELIKYIKEKYASSNYLKLYAGMVFDIGEVRSEVLGTHEIIVGANGVLPSHYNTNDTCTMLRFSFGGKSFMMCGDVVRSESDYVRIYSTGYFKSDVLQVTHHGINMLTKINKICSPTYALVPNGIENQQTRWKAQYDYFERTFPKNSIHYAGDYITAIEVTGGNMTLTKIPRYDNPTGKID